MEKEETGRGRKIRKALFYIGMFVIFLSVFALSGIVLIYRLQNPQLTETQLFLWVIKKQWLFLISLILGGLLAKMGHVE